MSIERYQFSSKIFALLSIYLNEIHGTSYSNRFWKIVLAPYVSKVVNNYSLLQSGNLDGSPTKYPHTSNFDANKSAIHYDSVAELAKRLRSIGNRRKIEKKLKEHDELFFGFHFYQALGIGTDRLLDPCFMNLTRGDYSAKVRRSDITENEDFSKVFIVNVIRFLPQVYVEYFNSILHKIPIFSPEKKIFHVSILNNLFTRFLIASYLEKGSKLFSYQHGGFYGEFKYHNSYLYENSISDRFHTWGWKLNETDVPSSAFRLEKFRLSYAPDCFKKFDLLMVYPYIYGVNRDKFTQESTRFFTALDTEKYRSICARPRPKSTFNRKANLNFLSGHVNKIDSGYVALSSLVHKSKIVVLLNYPSTTMFECLYVDHPVMALFNNPDPSEIVKPYYHFMFEVGLLHNSMESMANHLNTINLETWWDSIIHMEMYHEFKNTFLRKV